MATLKQREANRLNAQKSTGPGSVEGKARSSRNALISGIWAESEVLPWEDPAEREALRAEYHHHHQPCSPEERAMVDNLVHGEFLSRRFRRSEVTIILSKLPAGADLTDDATIGRAYAEAGIELGRLQRRMDANNRSFHRDLDELRLLKAERPPEEVQPAATTAPDPAAPEPDLPTAQPVEAATQTEQMASFRQNPEIGSPPPPGSDHPLTRPHW